MKWKPYGPFQGFYKDITPIIENQMDNILENEMETGCIDIRVIGFSLGRDGMAKFTYHSNRHGGAWVRKIFAEPLLHCQETWITVECWDLKFRVFI